MAIALCNYWNGHFDVCFYFRYSEFVTQTILSKYRSLIIVDIPLI